MDIVHDDYCECGDAQACADAREADARAGVFA